MKQFDRVKATFAPVRTDDLKPEAAKMIGVEGEFEAVWIVDHGCPYDGQWAMAPSRELFDAGFRVVWVPFCDLTILVDEHGGVARLTAAVGPDLVQDDPASRPKAFPPTRLVAEGEALAEVLTETLIFDRVLTAEERRRVEDYVLGKYGIDREEKGGEHESVHGDSEVPGGVRDEDPGRSGR
jgi:hypothetical protein